MKTRKRKTNPNAKSTCVLLLPFEAGLNLIVALPATAGSLLPDGSQTNI